MVLQQLIRRCPWPIIYKAHPTYQKAGGVADYSTKRVFINCPTRIRLEVLSHEIGHVRLYEKGVHSVYTTDRIRHETIAYAYSLHVMLKHHCKRELRVAMNNLMALREGKYGAHSAAAYFVVDSNLWKRCERFTRSFLSPAVVTTSISELRNPDENETTDNKTDRSVVDVGAS